MNDLIPWIVISQLSKRFESGAQLYGDRNWEKGQPLGRYLDSALRHLFQFLEGEINEDHGKNGRHLLHDLHDGMNATLKGGA